MKISIIVAVDEKRGIGRHGKLLFNIAEDHKRFRKLTEGHPVIMGRKTFEKDICGCLPKRSNIIVTRNKSFSNKGATIASSLEEAINLAKNMPGSQEIFIIGGGQIYQQAIELADKLYITKVTGVFNADTFFPSFSNFKKIVFEKKSKEGKFEYTFLELEK